MTLSTEKAWQLLFKNMDIVSQIESQGFFFLSANQIKEETNKEPRLMCKFDHRESRPATLKNNDCTILPVENGLYAIVKADGYADVDTRNIPVTPFYWSMLNQLQTLPLGFRSESQVIDAVFASGILTDFIGEKNLVLTLRGRLRTKQFDFFMRNECGDLPFTCKGAQVEVDAGYEADRVYIIEAKMGESSNFHMRQLYYPYRMWLAEGVRKTIVPISLSYYNGVISLTEYAFKVDEFYNTYYPVNSKQYSFETSPIVNSLEELLSNIALKDTTETTGTPPFPQANDLKKVRDVIDLVHSDINTKTTISEYWNIESRQGDYYANAAFYLGFLERSGHLWVLTKKGLNYVQLPHTRRKQAFIAAILERTVFYRLVKLMQSTGHVPERTQIAEVIIAHVEVNETTAKRRASTVKNWLYFIKNYFDE
jgi:hypothetical protein